MVSRDEFIWDTESVKYFRTGVLRIFLFSTDAEAIGFLHERFRGDDPRDETSDAVDEYQ